MRALSLCLALLLTSTVDAVDSCHEFFSKGVVKDISTHAVHLQDGPLSQAVIVNYQNGVSVEVLTHLPHSHNRWSLYKDMLHTLFVLHGRVVNFDVMALENSPQINCHSYACQKSGVPGLPDGWLDGARVMGRAETRSPFRVVLEEFFEPVSQHPFSEPPQIFNNSPLREGDVLVLVDERGMDVHSGVLIFKKDQVWVRSKLGQRLATDLPIQQLRALYKFSTFEVWRRSGLSREGS